MIVILEGLDGVGKTTLAIGLYDTLKKKYHEKDTDKVIFYPILKYAEGPDNPEINKNEYMRFKNQEMNDEEIANYLEKVITYNTKIVNKLNDEGKIIIIDRHLPSFFVYQVCRLKNPVYQETFSKLTKTIPFPINTLFVHIVYNEKKVKENLKFREVDKYDLLTLESHKEMELNYELYYSKFKPKNTRHIYFLNNDTIDESVEQLTTLVEFY